VETSWGKVLTAHKGGTWVVLGASTPFRGCSCGYVGTTDGWQDLAHDFRMDWEFDCAPDGNIALTGELDIRQNREFVLALAFGDSLHHALVTMAQALGTSFTTHRARFVEQWRRAGSHLLPLKEGTAGDDGRLYHVSHRVLLAHEDKTYDGAVIASLSIPWGEYAGDDDLGGYHLVWPRDMCHSGTALLAAGSKEVPLRALIYLASTQNEDGGFYQNFWINGEPYWRGTQLDETAFPILFAWRLHEAKMLQDFDPYPVVLKAAGYLIHHGPVTPQERWEENSGYSPSTLAAQIAALICAAACASGATRPPRATSKSTPTFWTPTSSRGRSPRTGRWFRTFAATSSASIPRPPAIPSPMKMPTTGSSSCETSPPGPPPRFRPRTSWMQGSSSWSATASASRAIRWWRILSAWWTPSSGWTRPSAPAGDATTTTATGSGRMADPTRDGDTGTPGRCSRESAGTTSWRRGATCDPSSGPWRSLPRRPGCCPSKCGHCQIAPKPT
jgi:glucoamylase